MPEGSEPRPWVAEVETSVESAARRIAERFPALAGRPVERFGAGWDNTAFLVDGEWLFRFPRRAVAVALLECEVRALPWLVGHLPVPVPRPTWVAPAGKGGFAGGEGPFYGYRAVDGRPLAEVDLPESALVALARPLGAFLRALHDAPVDEASRLGIPSDRFGKADVVARAPRLLERLADLASRGLVEPGPLSAIVGAAEPLANRVVAHGDLDARHILVGRDGALGGVIDWGDLHLGAPATDLAVVWHALPLAAHPVFFDAYGPVDEATRRLARFRALDVATAVLLWGLDMGDTVALRAARSTLGRLAAGP